MLKQLVVSTALVSLLATPVLAKEIITNGDFEDGLSSWTLMRNHNYPNAVFDIVDDGGNPAAYTPYNYQIRQDLEPIKVSDIKDFSISAKVVYTSNIAIIVTYVPKPDYSKYSDYKMIILSPPDTEWGAYDLLSQLDPTKTLESIELSGYASLNGSGTWYDDITMNTIDEEPVMAAMGLDICQPQEPVVEYVYNTEYVNVPVVEYVEVPVEKIVTKTVTNTVRVEVPVEKIVKVEVPVVEFVTVEVEKIVEVPVVEFVDVPVEVQVEVPVMVSFCNDINTVGMSDKDITSIKKSCEHINKWELRISKVVNGYGDNNGHHQVAQQ